MKFTRLHQVSLVAAVAAGLGVAAVQGGLTSIQPFAASLSATYDVVPLWSVADRVPLTRDPAQEFQMIGIPDGLGAHRDATGNVVVYMSQELTNTTLSEPVIGAPRSRGAFVTKALLDASGAVVSADHAYDTVYLNDTLVGPRAAEGNTTPGFGRFCSSALFGPREGFDRTIYFANEETSPAGSFDGLGGLSVAIFDGEAHALTDLGHFAWENTLVQPRRSPVDRLTVIMGMEDGPSSQDPLQNNSQLYLYVGIKSNQPGATALQRNGLVGGRLFVFRSTVPGKNSEVGFQTGTISGEWIPIPNAGSLSEPQLEAASDAVGAMIFARPEDGAFNPRNRNNYFFVTTGGAAGANSLGRLYSMVLNPANPAGPATLTVAYNADQIVAAGGDTALSPDNVGISRDYLMICEDGTTESRVVMNAKGRDGSIWRYDLTGNLGVDAASATRVVELDPPGRDGVAVGAGVWETSGIIAADGLFGPGSWLFDAQAHGPTAAPAPNTVEDGQLLLLKVH